jgi:hypothetical protein
VSASAKFPTNGHDQNDINNYWVDTPIYPNSVIFANDLDPSLTEEDGGPGTGT